MKKKITWATWLTIARIVVIPWLITSILWKEWKIAFMVLSFAAITDILDGHLARRWAEQSSLGALLDPIADKLLTVGCFAAGAYVGIVPFWFFLCSLGKEMVQLVGASFFYTLCGSSVMHANTLGKAAMVGQTGIIAWLFITHAFGITSSVFTTSAMIVVAVLMFLSLVVYAYQGFLRRCT